MSELGLETEDLSNRVIHVLNKSDLISAQREEELRHMFPNAAFVSALHNTTFDSLYGLIEEKINSNSSVYNFTIKSKNGDARAYLFQNGTVLNSTSHKNGNETLKVRLSTANFRRFLTRWPEYI